MKNQKNSGITLIALVITIIVLVILVGVTVSVTINTGLIENSKKAVSDYDKAQENEIAELKKVQILTAPRVNGDPADWEFDAETGTITKYKGSDTEVVIPNYISGVAIENIGYKGEDNGANGLNGSTITKLTISDGIKVIGNNALAVGSFTSISLPNSLEEIDEYAIHLNNVEIPELTIPGASGKTKIGDCAFIFSPIGKLTIEEGVISIGMSAFDSCFMSDNVTINIPKTVQSIGQDAFANNNENMKLIIEKGSIFKADNVALWASQWGVSAEQIIFE